MPACFSLLMQQPRRGHVISAAAPFVLVSLLSCDASASAAMQRIAVAEDQQHDAKLLMAVPDRYSAARELRAQDSDVVIAFLTSLAQYAVEGYEMEAADFIFRPVTQALLELKLPRLLKRCRRHDDDFRLQTIGASVHLHASGLLYADIFDHRICAQTVNGPPYAYGTLKEMEEVLPRGCFCISSQTILCPISLILRFPRHNSGSIRPRLSLFFLCTPPCFSPVQAIEDIDKPFPAGL